MLLSTVYMSVSTQTYENVCLLQPNFTYNLLQLLMEFDQKNIFV